MKQMTSFYIKNAKYIRITDFRYIIDYKSLNQGLNVLSEQNVVDVLNFQVLTFV